ncbi:BolA-like protein [[Candida] zeylanoides]|jgi:stress-induced morphogen
MSLTAESLKSIVEERLGASLVQVEDMSGGCGQAFAVIIVSQVFEGKNKLARARLVNGALKEEISSIHAFTQKVFTPEEWQAQGGK